MKYPKYYVNTDSVNIERKEIGISSGRDAREFSVGVRHIGTKESVKDATKIANMLAAAPEMLEALKLIWRTQGHILGDHMRMVITDAITKAEGRE